MIIGPVSVVVSISQRLSNVSLSVCLSAPLLLPCVFCDFRWLETPEIVLDFRSFAFIDNN